MFAVSHVVALVLLSVLQPPGALKFAEAVIVQPKSSLRNDTLKANAISRGKEPEEGEAHAEGGGEKKSENAGFIIVLGFGATVILFALSFAMANHSNKKISLFTWRCLDNIISIFLAVMIFQALDEVVVDAGILPKSHVVVVTFVYAVVLLTCAIGMSKLLRTTDKGREKDLAIFAASSAHFVGFGFMHASTVGVEHHAEGKLHGLIILVGVCLFIPLLYVCLFHVKTRMGMYNDPELIEKVDDIETDAGAMAVSITWTLVMCILLTGEFKDIEEDEDVAKSERQIMLIYCIVLSLVGCFTILYICDEESVPAESYAKKRFAGFASSVIAMSMAWGWLVWGKWHFHEHEFNGNPMFSRIWFAVVCSLVAIVVIVVLGSLKFSQDHANRAAIAAKEEMLLILTVSLVCGWAWEEAFDEGIETIAEDSHDRVFYHGAYKLMAGLIMMAVVLPVHVIYFKPMALAKEEEQEKSAAP